MLKDLRKEMNEFIEDLKTNIKDSKELDYLLNRTEKLYDTVFSTMEKIMDYKEDEMKELENRQEEQNKKMDDLVLRMKELYNDIYDEDYYDFEIVCPYCNHEFDANIDENITEITCPECENIIELDWNEESDD